ncbi:hypothetical protein N8787_02670 [Opitutaceae bacterium]|nr:hypothetical protein [Opitutaceae bacterium]
MNNDSSSDPNEEAKAPKAEPAETGSFWSELKRRKVVRVAITYAVVAWLIIQIASTTFGDFGIPVWAFRFVVIMLGLFFPVALIIAWAFELTPEGIRTTKSAQENGSDASVSKKQQSRRNWWALLLAAGLPTFIFGLLAIFFFIRSSPSGSETASIENAIAVMPLVNMSSHEENVHFAGGIHEDVLTHLSRIRWRLWKACRLLPSKPTIFTR